MSEQTITRRDLGGIATGAGLLAAASGVIVEASAQTALSCSFTAPGTQFHPL